MSNDEYFEPNYDFCSQQYGTTIFEGVTYANLNRYQIPGQQIDGFYSTIEAFDIDGNKFKFIELDTSISFEEYDKLSEEERQNYSRSKIISKEAI
jgi:hypothetical protein